MPNLTSTSWPKIIRVLLIIYNQCVKFESDWAKTVVCIVSRFYRQSAKFDLDFKKSFDPVTQNPIIIHNLHVKFESDWTKTDQSVLHAQKEKYAYTHSTNQTQTIILLQGCSKGIEIIGTVTWGTLNNSSQNTKFIWMLIGMTLTSEHPTLNINQNVQRLFLEFPVYSQNIIINVIIML